MRAASVKGGAPRWTIPAKRHLLAKNAKGRSQLPKQWREHAQSTFILPGLIVPVFLGVDILCHQHASSLSQYALQLLLMLLLAIIILCVLHCALHSGSRGSYGDVRCSVTRAHSNNNSDAARGKAGVREKAGEKYRRPKSEHVPNSARAYAASRSHYNNLHHCADSDGRVLPRVQETSFKNVCGVSAGDSEQERQLPGGHDSSESQLRSSDVVSRSVDLGFEESRTDDREPGHGPGTEASEECSGDRVSRALLTRSHKMITQPNIDLNRSIISQTTREGVLRVVEAEWEQLDEVNLITSLYRLAILRPGKNNSLQWNPVFQKILQGVDMMLDKTFSRSLANMIWALAKIGFDIRGHEDLIARIARRAAESTRDARSQDISFFMGGESRKKNLIFRRTQEISNLLWGLITLNYRRCPEVVPAVNDLFVEIARFPDFLPFCAPQELSNIAWSFSRSDPILCANVDVQKFLVQLAEYCGMRCADGIPRNVAMVAWGYHRLKVLTTKQTETLFGALENAQKVHPMKSWKPQEIATLLLAYADVGVKTEWFEFFLPRILGNLASWKPTDFTSVAYAYVKGGYHSPHLLSHLYANMPDLQHMHRNDLEQVVRAFVLADFRVDSILTKLASDTSWGHRNPHSGGLWTLPRPLLEEIVETYAPMRTHCPWYQAIKEVLEQRDIQRQKN